jgi:hypothetical protein
LYYAISRRAAATRDAALRHFCFPPDGRAKGLRNSTSRHNVVTTAAEAAVQKRDAPGLGREKTRGAVAMMAGNGRRPSEATKPSPESRGVERRRRHRTAGNHGGRLPCTQLGGPGRCLMHGPCFLHALLKCSLGDVRLPRGEHGAYMEPAPACLERVMHFFAQARSFGVRRLVAALDDEPWVVAPN